jgi:two-component system cell cycle response regulator CtrA
MMNIAADPYARIACLEAQLQTLQDQNDFLRAELGQNLQFPPMFKLTPCQACVLGVIMARPIAYASMIMSALYADKPDEPESPPDRILAVFIFNVRKKLRPFGIRIENIHGVGYRMAINDKQKLIDLMRAEDLSLAGIKATT